MAKILVVEDSSTVQAYMCRALRLHGHDVEPALNGEQGIQQAKACRPDLVTMDCRMPKMGGVQAAGLMAEDARLLHIPVLFVSSEDDKTQLKDALMLPNIAGYLLKPVNAEVLLARVNKILQLRKCKHSNPAWDTMEHRNQQAVQLKAAATDR